MTSSRTRAFTLIELLVVITIILILIAAIVPILNEVWRRADVLQCKNNMKQIGTWFITEAVASSAYSQASGLRGYPHGGSARYSPGEWGLIHGKLLKSLKVENGTLTTCPSVKDSPLKPTGVTCSYAYLGSPAVTYECRCDACEQTIVVGGANVTVGKHVWQWYWSGVLYNNGHDYNTGTRILGGDFGGFRRLPLADNLVFQLDDGSTPTIPFHQETDTFEGRERTYRDNRALRALPETPADHRADQPLIADIVIFRTTNLDDLPEDATDDINKSWGANDMAKFRTAPNNEITDDNKIGTLFANHCLTSASSRKDWGINIFYSNNRVAWKQWDEIRFQVMERMRVAGQDDRYDCYFF